MSYPPRIGMFLITVLLVTACGGGSAPEAARIASVAASPTIAPAEAPTAAPSATPVPATATPTTTPIPTATPSPSATLGPTEALTPIPAPTELPTPAPEAPTASPDRPEPAQLRYFFPVQAAKVRYVDYHHDYPAADIECPIGSRFVAVTGGVVDFVSAQDIWRSDTDNPPDRGGLAVAIIGDDGVRYYGSHLQQIAAGIAPGVRVEAGQLLGLTGNSGNANRPGIIPHLHFGISPPTTPDDWRTRRGTVRPYDYLRAWERGENVTPQLE